MSREYHRLAAPSAPPMFVRRKSGKTRAVRPPPPMAPVTDVQDSVPRAQAPSSHHLGVHEASPKTADERAIRGRVTVTILLAVLLALGSCAARALLLTR
jgi:hypothetical protein